MTTSTLQATPATGCEATSLTLAVRLSPVVQVHDPAKLATALNRVLGLDLGTEAERLVRAEIRESLR